MRVDLGINESNHVAVHEISHSDVATFPIALVVLVAAAGPMSIVMLMVFPVVLLVAFSLLSFVAKEWLRFTFLGPPMFIITGTALSLDYVLLLLWRFNEDFAAHLEETGYPLPAR